MATAKKEVLTEEQEDNIIQAAALLSKQIAEKKEQEKVLKKQAAEAKTRRRKSLVKKLRIPENATNAYRDGGATERRIILDAIIDLQATGELAFVTKKEKQ